jgi:hypothetical protein
MREEINMALQTTRCTVIEIPALSQGGPDDDPPRDLLPWADPYIARLLSSRRLQAALDDSLSFVESEAEERPFGERRQPYESTVVSVQPCRPRFDLEHPFSD